MIRSTPGAVGAVGVAAPPCVTANVRPAIVSVPLRGVVLVFAATLKPAWPLPLPLGLVTVIRALHRPLPLATYTPPLNVAG
jgi:hypothetical protein